MGLPLEEDSVTGDDLTCRSLHARAMHLFNHKSKRTFASLFFSEQQTLQNTNK
jgi:hypothetical protein